jgi:hypothetical protein
MSNSEAVIQVKLKISLLLGIAWFTDSDLYLAPENNTIFQKWAVLLHTGGLSQKTFWPSGAPSTTYEEAKMCTLPCLV